MLRERLTRLIEPALLGLGFELVLLEFSAGISRATLRLFIDKSEGVSMEDCETASREVAALLDVEDPIKKAYQLEVSSPGLDRPLTKLEHYQRFAGQKAKLQTMAPIDGRKRFVGVLAGIQGEEVVLEVDGVTVVIPFAEIDKARVVPDYEKEFAKNKTSDRGLPHE